MSYIRQALRLKKRKELFFHSAGVDDGWGMKHLYIYIYIYLWIPFRKTCATIEERTT